LRVECSWRYVEGLHNHDPNLVSNEERPMGDASHGDILQRSVRAWNEWRRSEPDVSVDLKGLRLPEATLRGVDLRRADLRGAELSQADLGEARLSGADLRNAILTGADLRDASLARADLREVDLSGADLRGARLNRADLGGAKLVEADLRDASLVGSVLDGADLTSAKLSGSDLAGASLAGAVLRGASLNRCGVWGISRRWLDLSDVADQRDLFVRGVRVDNVEVALLVDLVLHSESVRTFADTLGRRGVLILSRFYAERRAVVEAIKDGLRNYDLVPITFDWRDPSRGQLRGTIQRLAQLSRFVIADATDVKDIHRELAYIVPQLPTVPILPIVRSGHRLSDMFDGWTGYDTMLPPYEYEDEAHLTKNLEEALIQPVVEWEAQFKT